MQYQNDPRESRPYSDWRSYRNATVSRAKRTGGAQVGGGILGLLGIGAVAFLVIEYWTYVLPLVALLLVVAKIEKKGRR
jgi:hypothetical protein